MMAPFAMRTLSALLLPSVILAGCMGWSLPSAPTPQASAADTSVVLSQTRMRVWAEGRVYELREAVWRGDSLLGQDAREATPVRLARSAVDSVSVRKLRPTATFLTFTGIVVGTGAAILGLYVIACASGGCD
jgi:hypothetical protein